MYHEPHVWTATDLLLIVFGALLGFVFGALIDALVATYRKVKNDWRFE